MKEIWDITTDTCFIFRKSADFSNRNRKTLSIRHRKRYYYSPSKSEAFFEKKLIRKGKYRVLHPGRNNLRFQYRLWNDPLEVREQSRGKRPESPGGQ